MTDRNAVDVHPEGKRHLAFGYSCAIPDGVKAAWGARLILDNRSYKFGGDLVWDRQDGWSDDEDSKKLLHDRLNYIKPWAQPLAVLINDGKVKQDVGNEVVVYEDELIKVVGNSNGSYGYFYIAGWLK